MSGRRISPFSPNTSPVFEQAGVTLVINSENAPWTSDKRTVRGEDLPPSPVSILQEISNSSRRSRHSTRGPALNTIFQDSTATEGTATTMSWYHEGSNNNSPSDRLGSPSNMTRLRQGSLNEKTPPPLNGPLVKEVRGRKKARMTPRSSSFEASQYIEHLESQMNSLTTRLNALTSPTTTKAQAAKLRGLHTQVRSQRKELSEWERKFEERVDDEIYRRTKFEAGLKTRIKTLEDEIDMKEVKIKELGWELENSWNKMKEAESLESTNQNLERRVDVLTELLAQSPTRAEFPTTVLASGGIEAVTSPRRTPRPKSLILPRILSSPGSSRYSSGHGIDRSARQSRHSISTPCISESPHEEMIQSLDGALAALAQNDELSASRAASSETKSGNATSSHSGPSVSSRPTSIISNSSFGASWGLPPPVGTSEDTKIVTRPRKMRRFPSGSCALKPLVLPIATTITQSLPASAPVESSNVFPNRPWSNTLIDPTTAFLSKCEDSSTFITPTQPGRRRSASWAQNQALRALEGKPHWTPEMDGQDSEQKPILHDLMFNDDNSITLEDLSSTQPIKRRSLQAELDQLQKLGLEMSDSPAVPADDISKCDSDRTYRLIPTDGRTDLDALTARYPDPHHSPSFRRRRTTTSSISTPPESQTPNLHSPSPRQLAPPLSTLSHPPPMGPSSPLSLAKTILRNAWSTGRSTKLGGLAWWLLGLIFGPSRRPKRSRFANALAVEEEPSPAWDWGPYSAQASHARRKELLVRAWREWREGAGLEEEKAVEVEKDRVGAELMAVSPLALSVVESPVRRPQQFCEDCVEPSSRRSLRLWLRFSVALLLAVGVAIREGPAALLVECPPGQKPVDALAGREQSELGDGERKALRSQRRKCVVGPELAREGLLRETGVEEKMTHLNKGYWGWEVAPKGALGEVEIERAPP